LLVFVWFIGITTIPGLSLLSILYKDLKRFELIELFVLAIGIGISYLVIISYLLDEFLIINIITLIIAILPFPCLLILLHYEKIYHSFKNIRNNLKKDALRKFLTIKSKLSKFNASTVLLILVLCFITFIELRDVLSTIVLPVYDPWFWLIESKKIAVTGHLLTERATTAHSYFRKLPRGAAYFLALMFLPNLANPYYIILFIGPFLSLLQCLGVYSASKKLLNSDKLAIYSVLVYGTSRLVIWRGKIYTTESLGLFLITIMALFLFEKSIKADILGLFVITSLGLTSFSSFAPLILPTLIYFVLYKSHKTSAIIIVGIAIGSILLPNFARTMLNSISVSAFTANMLSLTMFYNNAQWSFGYSLAFSFIGIIYYLINRSSERMFYVICFLELFILINFVSLEASWMNARLFPFLSIFASTLTAQGLWSSIKAFRNALTPLSNKGNAKLYIIHFIIALCIIYQIFFGMVRGYHATIGRSHEYEEVDAALWLYDNSSENTVVLVSTRDFISYSSILYPRTLINNRTINNYSSVNVASYCSQNNVSYVILEIDEFSQAIKVNDHFDEVYSNTRIVIFVFN